MKRIPLLLVINGVHALSDRLACLALVVCFSSVVYCFLGGKVK